LQGGVKLEPVSRKEVISKGTKRKRANGLSNLGWMGSEKTKSQYPTKGGKEKTIGKELNLKKISEFPGKGKEA